MSRKVLKKRVIPNGWVLKKIGEIAKTGSGGTPLSSRREFYDNGEIPWINSGEVGQHSIKKAEKFITPLGLSKSSATIFPPNSVLIALYGATAGRVSLLDMEATTNQAICGIYPNVNFDSKFLKYYLDILYTYLVGVSTGSARDNLSQKGIQELKIPFPSLKIQNQIAKVLSDLDAKIEVNNKINAELEAMAKTIYDYWFVQFDFPDANGKPYKSSGGKMEYNKELKREIPEGWKVNMLGDLGNFKNGVNYDPSNPGKIPCPIINVRNISASSYFLKNEDLDIIYLNDSDVRKYSVNMDSIIIARSGIPGATRLIADFQPNTLYCGFAIHYQLSDTIVKFPIFFYLKSIERIIKEGSGGTILKNVNQTTLNGLKIVLPKSESLLNSFNKKINPLFKKINLIQKENQKLTEIRDWLLPMLMNGQVKVN